MSNLKNLFQLSQARTWNKYLKKWNILINKQKFLTIDNKIENLQAKEEKMFFQ
jgi:hypothetical protein